MPLIKSKSKVAFKKNVEAEMKSGKPQNQSLAIAYDVKRRAKKASGGSVQSGSSTMNYAKGGAVSHVYHDQAGEDLVGAVMKRRKKMANGGSVDSDENAILKENGSEASSKIFEHRNAEILENDMNEPIEEMSQPMDSNMHGDEREMDRVSKIRQRMAKRLR